MTDEDPTVDAWDSPGALFDDAPIRERMLDVVLGLRAPTTVGEIADRVDCDPETARDYLDWFEEMGMVREHPGRPARHEPNRSYLRWRRVEGIRESLTEEEIVAELEATSETIQQFQDRFDAGGPEEVSLLSVEADIEDAWEALSAWKTARERAELLDAARRAQPEPVDG